MNEYSIFSHSRHTPNSMPKIFSDHKFYSIYARIFVVVVVVCVIDGMYWPNVYVYLCTHKPKTKDELEQQKEKSQKESQITCA